MFRKIKDNLFGPEARRTCKEHEPSLNPEDLRGALGALGRSSITVS
jgi:hypothetical protein